MRYSISVVKSVVFHPCQLLRYQSVSVRYQLKDLNNGLHLSIYLCMCWLCQYQSTVILTNLQCELNNLCLIMQISSILATSSYHLPFYQSIHVRMCQIIRSFHRRLRLIYKNTQNKGSFKTIKPNRKWQDIWMKTERNQDIEIQWVRAHIITQSARQTFLPQVSE